MASCRNYVDTVATEIWLNCWISCDNAQLRRLSLVCRYFQTICQPLLFRVRRVGAPRVEPGNWMSTTQELHYKIYKLTRLAASPHAASVRTWYWRGDFTLDEELPGMFPLITNIHVLQDTWLRLVAIFKTTLGAYQRLAVLHLSEFTIDADVRRTLASLEFLEDLTLYNCDIICRTGTLLRLHKLDLGGNNRPAATDQLQLAAHNTLQTLRLGSSHDGVCLLAALVTHQLPGLVRITISLTETVSSLFFDLLELCPRLESIHIDNLIIDGSFPIPHRLPLTTLPVLNHFHGPHNVAGLFVDGRPVVDIMMKGPFGGTAREIIPCLRAIAGGSAPLQNLFLHTELLPTCMPEFFAAVGSLFPELRVLSIQLKAIPAHSQLEVHGPDGDDEEEPEVDQEADEVDDRIVELWDGSYGVASSEPDHRFSPIIDNDSDIEDAPPTMLAEIPVELPGHMYMSSGSSYPPAFDDLQPSDPPATLTVAMDSIYTGRTVLPLLLEELHMYNWRMMWPVQPQFHLAEEHRAVLALERLLPCLQKVRLGDQRAWTRTRNMWRRTSSTYAGGMASHGGGRIVSQVWKADGTERDEGDRT
ncbi:hypothetical protein C8R44DRAFT_657932 [Mycena epipterygia]|nr:hypothetical protein C8R44DRAFT_657932 [Mycena epipterygia]